MICNSRLGFLAVVVAVLFLFSSGSVSVIALEISLADDEWAQTAASVWNIEMEDGLLKMDAQSEVRHNSFVCSLDGDTQVAHLRIFESQTDVVATRQGRVVSLAGQRNGKAIRKTYKIDDAPWFQAIPFCLEAFLRFGGEETKFWVINPERLRIGKFRATSMGIETIEYRQQAVKTIKVRVQLDGALAAFWKGYYYYREDDGRLLWYHGEDSPFYSASDYFVIDVK